MRPIVGLMCAAIILCGLFNSFPALGQVQRIELQKTELPKIDCEKAGDSRVGFNPQAYTLTSMFVRDKAPEYSFVRGQWILGDAQGVLKPGTCLQILRREEIGVIQIWFLVRYQDEGQVRTGWVWGGTKEKDEGSYIGGNTNPPTKSELRDQYRWFATIWAWVVPVAYAQGDVLPAPPTAPGINQTMIAKLPTVGGEYLVELPVVKWQVSVGSLSAVFLFAVMLSGMVAKAVWDETSDDGGRWPSMNKMFRPFLVSPIAFSAFWGPMYIQQGGAGLSLTMALYAFQIGFMWQHVLEKKTNERTGV